MIHDSGQDPVSEDKETTRKIVRKMKLVIFSVVPVSRFLLSLKKSMSHQKIYIFQTKYTQGETIISDDILRETCKDKTTGLRRTAGFFELKSFFMGRMNANMKLVLHFSQQSASRSAIIF